MKMTEEDSDVFEITDFTTASEWERFIARLEEVFHEWKLTSVSSASPLGKGELTTGNWATQVETLQFADFKFTITHHFLKRKDTSPEPGTQEGKDEASKGDGASEGREDAAKLDSQTDIEEAGSVPIAWQDMMSIDNDFPSRAHCLVRWYGLRQFVIIAPSIATDSINTESRANILLSSVSICLNNTGCQVPIFVQVHEKWRRLYQGQCEGLGFRSTFEMIHLKHAPSQYSHLAGLLDVFKSKLNCPVSPLPPVTVSVRFTYVLQDWNAYNWSQAPPDIDSVMGAEVGCTEFGDLPFGACEDPVSELHLSTTWPSLSEEMIVDNDVYSDLDPLQAPHWSVRVRMADDIQCLLGDYLEEFVILCRRQESTDQLLGGLILDDRRDSTQEGDISQALQRLTEPVGYSLPSLGTVVTRATSKLQMHPEEAPIATDLLNEILLYLFPDARTEADKDDKKDSESTKSATTSSGPTPAATPVSETAPKMDGSDGGSQAHVDSQYKEMFRQLKSAPSGSLTMRLAVCLCIINHSYGGLRAVAHLWQEFVLEMRYRWENNYPIPNLEPGSPNMGCSLLHQKLQMLNCCINHKITREAMQTESGVKPGSPEGAMGWSDILSSSDEEFFDVEEDVEEKGETKQKRFSLRRRESKKSLKNELNVKKAEREKNDDEKLEKKEGQIIERKDSTQEPDVEGSFKDSWTHQAEGRLRKCGDMKLLNQDEWSYIPVTQQPAPMTEDLLDEHAEVLAKLGTSAEGAHLRARMQSACLLSDMEAFKSANPGCTLGDFVRWYSPRDWVEEDTDGQGNVTTKGALSQRMQIPGNMWAEVWQSARPIPVRRQKRLFDDTKEAEKVLHFLSSLKPGDVVTRLMPMLIHAAIAKLLEQDGSCIAVIKDLVNSITTKATKAMRASRIDIKRYEDIVRQLTVAELLVTRAQSLKAKFSEEEKRIKEDSRSSSRSPSRSPSKLEESSKMTLSSDLETFVAVLLEQPEVSILGAARGPVGSVIHGLFSTAQKSAHSYTLEEEEGDSAHNQTSDFPVPAGKEYLLRATQSRPAPWSRPTPQRMFCIIIKDDFRLAGAFGTDTTFQ